MRISLVTPGFILAIEPQLSADPSYLEGTASLNSYVSPTHPLLERPVSFPLSDLGRLQRWIERSTSGHGEPCVGAFRPEPAGDIEDGDARLGELAVLVLLNIGRYKVGGHNAYSGYQIAKTAGGIPVSAQPISSYTERLEGVPGYVQSRVWVYERPGGGEVVIKEHWYSAYGQEPHFNTYVYGPGGTKLANVHTYFQP